MGYGSGLNITITPPLITTDYILTGLDVNGCSNADTTKIIIDKACDYVWPGDANGDGTTNNSDILELGLRFGKSGSARVSISNQWTPHESLHWGQDTVSTGLNVTHADCDGDGIVGWTDTLGVYQNYGLTHPLKPLLVTNYLKDTADLYFNSSSTIIGNNDYAFIDVYIGHTDKPIQDLYGIAFNLKFSGTAVVPGTLYFKINDTTWVGTIASNAIRLNKVNELNKEINGVITRVNHSMVNGYGKIGTISFRASTNSTDSFALYASNTFMINNLGKSSELTTSKITIIVENIPASVKENNWKDELTFFPNPCTNSLNFDNLIPGEKSTFTIYTLLGEVIYKNSFITNSKNHITSIDLKSGAYLLHLKNGNNQLVENLFIYNE